MAFDRCPMKTFLACLFLFAQAATAVDLSGLAAIGHMASYSSARDTVTVVCADHSQQSAFISWRRI